MLKIVLLISALLGAALAVESCSTFSGTTDLFGELPAFRSCPTVKTCKKALCDCLDLDYSTESNSCNETAPEFPCGLVDRCLLENTECLAVFGSRDDCGSWSTDMKDQYEEMLQLDPVNYSQTELYDSCAVSTCKFVQQNAASCLSTWEPEETCFSPIVNNSLPLAPFPSTLGAVLRNANGSYSEPVIRVLARMTFNGDFSSSLAGGNTSDAAVRVRNAMQQSIEGFLEFPIFILSMFRGSLVSDFEAAVKAGNTGLARRLAARLKEAQNDKAFYAKLEAECKCKIAGALASAIKLLSDESSALRDVESKCDSRCIAFVVIGLVATGAVIVGAVVIFMIRSAADSVSTVQTEKPQAPEGEMAQNPLA